VLNLDAGFIPSYPTNGTTWYDLSYGNNNGTLLNGTSYSSLDGGTIVFDGTDDEVNTSYGPTLDDFTIGIWFKDNGSPTYGRLVDKSYTGGFWLGRNGSTPNSWGGGIKETSDPYGIFLNLTDGQWNYLTSIRSGTNHILYGNGITNTTSNTVTSSSLDSTTISIGAWSGPVDEQRFKGDIGTVQVYNRALTSDEVLQNYNAGLARFNTENIVKNNLILDLDASNAVSYPTTGTVWRDLSGYGNAGTLINGPTFNSTTKSIVFDGTDDNVNLGNASDFLYNGVVSVNVVVNTNVINEYRKMFVTVDSGTASIRGLYFSIGPPPYDVYFGVKTNNGDNAAIYNVNISVSNWVNLCGTYDGSNIKLFLNGVLVATQSLTGIINPQGIARISGYDNNNETWDGSIRTVQIYDRPLSNSEILQNYYGAPIITDGLVMALDAGNLVSYPGSGTSWRDLTSNANNVTLVNGPTFNSNNGGSIVLDGTDDYIVSSNLPTNSPLSFSDGNFTIEHWIRITAYEPSTYFGLTNMIMSKGPASTYNYATQVTNSTTLSFIHRDNSEGLVFLNFTVPTLTNNITQIVFSITLTQVSLYLNGMLSETKNLTGNPITPYSYDELVIGGMYSTSNTNFTGNMYIHRIYNKPLSNNEVSQNYNATKARFGL
jgi:hypothetical protein